MVQAHPEAQKPSDFREAFLLLPGTPAEKPIPRSKIQTKNRFSFLFAYPKAVFRNTPRIQFFSSRKEKAFLYAVKPYLYRIYTEFIQKRPLLFSSKHKGTLKKHHGHYSKAPRHSPTKLPSSPKQR